MHYKSIYVIILNYNHLDDLIETIHSFKKQDYPGLHIVVSDNSSTDNSVKWLKENHPEIEILENKVNLGFAKGNNIAIQYALDQKADYILLANNDLSFQNPSIISQLINQIKDNPKYIIGPKQNFYYTPEKEFTQGHFFMNVTHKHFNSLRIKYCKENFTLPNNLAVVDYIAGSFVLFPSKLIKDIGFIDPNFHFYGEDADFFLRAWKKGYVSIVDKEITILHKVSATSGTGSAFKKYYQSRNIWLNLKKHKDIGNHMFYFKFKAMKSILKNILIDLMHFRIKHIWALKLGLWHGLVVNKFGKYY